MGSCKNRKKNIGLEKIYCPLCKNAGNNIHYLAIKKVVKESSISAVREETYFACTDNSCDVVFYNKEGDRIFLTQDINMAADFDEITKPGGCNCNSNVGCSNCTKEEQGKGE